jgi:(p)ppGpp synthase/HD superfamily hydrolase
MSVATLHRAIELALIAHKGQLDLAGELYLLHPLRVMMAMDTDEERIVAVLHDAVEDSKGKVTLSSLLAEGFSYSIVMNISLLTKSKAYDYAIYIEQIKLSPLATKVKLADLADNMNLTRFRCATEKDKDRAQKYARAARYLKGESKEVL